jgi:hypothetical protein
MLFRLDADGFEQVLQELLATSMNESAALGALETAIHFTPESINYLMFSLMIATEMFSAITRVLFGMTKNMLTTSSSDIFVALSKLTLKILREKA